MSNIYHFITEWMQARSDLTVLINDRFGPVNVAQFDKRPNVTYKIISTEPGHSLDGVDGLTRVRVQFDIYSDSIDSAIVIDELIFGTKDDPRLDGFDGTAGAVRVQRAMKLDSQDIEEPPLHGESQGPYRRSTDIEFWYED